MSNTGESGVERGEGKAQAGGGAAANATPSTELDAEIVVEASACVAIVRAASGGAQLLFVQPYSGILRLPTGRADAEETEAQAAARIVLQDAGVRGVLVHAGVELGALHCKDKKFKEEGMVVRVVRPIIRVLLATPTEQFAIESRETVTLRWISEDELKKLRSGGADGVTFQFNHNQAAEVAKRALNHFAVAVPFLKAESGGEGEGGGDAAVGNGSFIRYFAVLDFEATCWDQQEAGARAKQDAESEIIEFPTVLYRVDGDVLEKVSEFRR
jgi:hypothetical protein